MDTHVYTESGTHSRRTEREPDPGDPFGWQVPVTLSDFHYLLRHISRSYIRNSTGGTQAVTPT